MEGVRHGEALAGEALRREPGKGGLDGGLAPRDDDAFRPVERRDGEVALRLLDGLSSSEIADLEHNSVSRPLRALELAGRIRVTRVHADSGGTISPDDVRSALTPTTRLIAVTHASNVLGTVPPITEIFEWMRARPGGGWPEKVDAMIAALSKERGLPRPDYVQIEGDDFELLRTACRTGRMPAVTYGYSPTGRYGRVSRFAEPRIPWFWQTMRGSWEAA